MCNMTIIRSNLPYFKELLEFPTKYNFWKIDHLGPVMEEKQRKIYAFVAKCQKIFMLVSYTMLLSVFTLPFVTRPRRLPLLCYQPFNLMVSPYYEIMVFWQFINAHTILSFACNVYGIFLGLIVYLYCQTMMLKKALIDLDMEIVNTEEEEKECFAKLKEYVEYHSKLDE